ncbi:hypothetical protein AB0G73_30600 [Streptomyces sp. NPDC020719]|uniref:hypothetical protein n=1 Tax=Streptomyces sp. NPDC020719 TaxID=3154896 RepID=UPI0033FC44AC
MCPQSGDDRFASGAASYGVPGPSHVTELPSPSLHTTSVGSACAITETPGTEAVADTRPHLPRSNHSHVGRLTSCSPGGLVLISGEGSRS